MVLFFIFNFQHSSCTHAILSYKVGKRVFPILSLYSSTQRNLPPPECWVNDMYVFRGSTSFISHIVKLPPRHRKMTTVMKVCLSCITDRMSNGKGTTYTGGIQREDVSIFHIFHLRCLRGTNLPGTVLGNISRQRPLQAHLSDTCQVQRVSGNNTEGQGHLPSSE